MSGPVGMLAEAIGAQEAALRLLLSVVLALPIAIVLRCLPSIGSNPTLKLAYVASTGFAVAFYNFGADVMHASIACAFAYLTIRLLGPTKLLVQVNFVFHMTYLLVGYWVTGTDTYDISWTMPHCVLTLRLIGLCFDMWDGSKPPEKLSASNRLTALREAPSPFEIFGHVFFPASYLVGPQFSMVRFKKFLAGELDSAPGPSCIQIGLKRFALGLGYLLIYQIGTLYIPDEYFLTDEFASSSFLKKHVILGIWGKVTLSKYLSCWLLTEGSCIAIGLAYNGVNKETNEPKWDGCRNVEVGIFEGCTKFGHYIDSFNINTNNWVAQYIYKRCAFLGSREASQGITLLFLAVWHGFHTGYYITFFMEFSIILMEKQLQDTLTKAGRLQGEPSTLRRILQFIVLKLYVTVFMGFCLIPFTQMNFVKWWAVYKTLYFSGFILFFPWTFVYKPLLKMYLKGTKPQKAE